MKQFISILIILVWPILSIGQSNFHVSVNGSSKGNGTLESPWDLQTALSSIKKVKGKDVIWLHEGVYNGRFTSRIKGKESDKPIRVKPYKNAKVVLNGNVRSTRDAVLTVYGGNVIFENFEVTFLGKFSRDQNEKGFEKVAGISHNSGEDCQFINLKIHNVPGTGFGSWRRTGGSLIQDCVIYNNGYMSSKRGSGVGIYVQNESEEIRLIKNNIIFNNYYKGVEVWSASTGKKFEFVKNVTLHDNILFNNGNPGGVFRDNIIVATGDKKGQNLAKNIKIIDNILYHNTDFINNEVGGDAASLTIGFNRNAPAQNIVVNDNLIVGRNNALRLLHAKSLTFNNNTVYSGYVFQTESTNKYAKTWNFGDNHYYTKKAGAFRVVKKNINLNSWRKDYGLDKTSTWNHIRHFNLKSHLKISQLESNPSNFYVTLFHKKGENVIVDFSKFQLKRKTKYRIYDIENPNMILAKGKLGKKRKVSFNMNSKVIQKPLHNDKTQKTLNNFGVFVIEFENKR